MGALVAFCLLWAGCGGGNGETTSGSAGPLTKSAFIKQANLACQEGNKRRDNLVAKTATEEGAATEKLSAKKLEALVLDVLVPVHGETLEEVKELGPPADAEPIIKEFEKGLREAKQNPGQAYKQNPFVKANEAAIAYGLKECLF